MNFLQRILFKSIDTTVVSLFRVGFGAFMIYQIIYYYNIDYTYQFMSGPQMLFPYEGLSFLKPLSLPVLKGIHFGLLVSAVFICIGFLYRYAMIFFFLGFSYFSFVDKTLYNNHLYLISLIAFVMIFIEADKKYSLKAYFSKNKPDHEIVAWNQYILMFLISLPYFFGGIAKLSFNWLATDLPVIIVAESQGNFLYSIFSEKTIALFFTYGGLIFDLCIVFLLLMKKTRRVAVVMVLFFNYTNHTILFNDIGLFPMLMMFSTILFFDSEQVKKFLRFFSTKQRIDEIPKGKTKEARELSSTEADSPKWNLKHKLAVTGLGLFVLFQMMFPLRHLFITDNPEWSADGFYFSWHMKLQSIEVTNLTMELTDKSNGAKGPIDVKSFLSKNQMIHLAEDPGNFIQLAHYLSKRIEKETGIKDPKITANVELQFNGLPKQLMFDPELDLTKIEKNGKGNDSWIYPLGSKE